MNNRVIDVTMLVGTAKGKYKNDFLYMQCKMEDGSIWNCDPDGTNWKKVGLSFQELTDKFNEANRQ